MCDFSELGADSPTEEVLEFFLHVQKRARRASGDLV